MRKIDTDGLMMCRIQGRIFEMSLDYLNCSSLIFVKKYMNSVTARSMDREIFLNTTKSDIQVLEDLNNDNDYGQNKYSKDVMYWMGYIYRYWAYVYQIDSKKIYQMFPGSKLEKLYYVYHTFDCGNAIERIIENNDLDMNIDINDKAKKEIVNKMSQNRIFTRTL